MIALISVPHPHPVVGTARCCWPEKWTPRISFASLTYADPESPAAENLTVDPSDLGFGFTASASVQVRLPSVVPTEVTVVPTDCRMPPVSRVVRPYLRTL